MFIMPIITASTERMVLKLKIIENYLQAIIV